MGLVGNLMGFTKHTYSLVFEFGVIPKTKLSTCFCLGNFMGFTKRRVSTLDSEEMRELLRGELRLITPLLDHLN